MDVFNSALRNPLPPLRKDIDKLRSPENENVAPPSPNMEYPAPSATHSANTSGSEDHPDLDLLRKKKSSRRKHRNSHLGCGTCKKRRIKCDENLPQCINCVKGKLHCAYLNLDVPARNALRMAQYNQNLRHDRPDEPFADKDDLDRPQLYQPQVAMPFAPHPMAMAQPQNPPFVQSPYGPMVPFQVNQMQPSYSMPIQVMPQMPMYQNQDQPVPFLFPQQPPLMTLPPATDVPQDYSMLRPSQPPTAFVTANASPAIGQNQNPPQPSQPGLLVPLPLQPGSSPSHPAFTPSVQNPPDYSQPAPSGLKSPLLIELPNSSIGEDHSVKLPPIDAKSDTVPMLQGSDKVPSILKLLS